MRYMKKELDLITSYQNNRVVAFSFYNDTLILA